MMCMVCIALFTTRLLLTNSFDGSQVMTFDLGRLLSLQIQQVDTEKECSCEIQAMNFTYMVRLSGRRCLKLLILSARSVGPEVLIFRKSLFCCFQEKHTH